VALYPGDPPQQVAHPAGPLTAADAWPFLGGTVYADRLAGRI
jgi:hypothetical protein